MGVRILDGTYDGGKQAAVLVDWVSGTAFGPMFWDAGEAENFLEWLRTDPRTLEPDTLARHLAEYRATLGQSARHKAGIR